MCVHQVLQGGDAQLNGSTAARKVAAAEAGAEQMQGRTTFCGEVADAGEDAVQPMLSM